MKKEKLVSAILCVLLVTSLFSGCQAAPDTAVVAGKNDGVFESALNSSAEPVENANTETFSYTNTFTSTDGKIEFNINDDEVQYSGNPMPVLRVTPHSITPEEAKTVYTALFGDDPNAPAELTTDKVVMDITDMEFGFARTKIKDERFDFYLVPSVTLSGSYTMYNESGEEIYTYPENGRSDVVLVLNLVDGSVINYAQ